MVANVRSVQETRAGDTIFDAANRAAEALPGYQDVHSMVFAGIYPTDTTQDESLRDALAKLRLNDASLHYEPETSTALGFGFGLALGLVLALMKLSSVAPNRWIATVYIEFFRGVPALLVFIGILAWVGNLARLGLLPRTRPILPGEVIVSD